MIYSYCLTITGEGKYEDFMKILLMAVNAKYIHSNPALYSLKAYAGEREGRQIAIAEYTINHRREEILADLYRQNPDLLAISCYIWNWELLSVLLKEIPKILPRTEIWLGGPEVSYNPEQVLMQFPMVKGIMVGEGEETFRELAEGSKELSEIRGIVYRQDGIVRTKERKVLDLSQIPFLYQDLSVFANRIIYYESSRGCPYRCSYCLSSIDKSVRFRKTDVVKRELQYFLDQQVAQVKFVDRTFNCDHEHAVSIWRYLSEHDNGVTNFHFEIEADILTKEELTLLSHMRPGLMQMEIGVQTTNPESLREIRRHADTERIGRAVSQLRQAHNIHIHLDLIAGLPFEDYESFACSFNQVYGMRPQQLQLGFLKILKGSHMYEMADAYGIQYLSVPPYEVLSTRWLAYEKILLLKEVEEMVEIYYNSGQFNNSISLLEQVYADAFSLYRALADFHRAEGCLSQAQARVSRYEALLRFMMTTALREKEMLCREVLTYDYYLRENVKSRPGFAPVEEEELKAACKKKLREFYAAEEVEHKVLSSYRGYDSRQMRKMTHAEVFRYPVWRKEPAPDTAPCEQRTMVIFDYMTRDALTYEARTVSLPID